MGGAGEASVLGLDLIPGPGCAWCEEGRGEDQWVGTECCQAEPVSRSPGHTILAPISGIRRGCESGHTIVWPSAAGVTMAPVSPCVSEQFGLAPAVTISRVGAGVRPETMHRESHADTWPPSHRSQHLAQS